MPSRPPPGPLPPLPFPGSVGCGFKASAPIAPCPCATLLLLMTWFLCWAYSILEVIAPGPWLVEVAVLVRIPPLPALRCWGDRGYVFKWPSAPSVPLPWPCKLAPEKLRIGAVMLTSCRFLFKLLVPVWWGPYAACEFGARVFRLPA